MSFLLGRILLGGVGKNIVAKEATQVAVTTVEKQAVKTSLGSIASMGGKVGLGLGVASLSYSGVKSIGNGLSNLTGSSLSGLGSSLDGVGNIGSDIGGSIIEPILLLGGVGIVLFLMIPKKK